MGLQWLELAYDQFKSFLARKNQFWPVQIYFDQFKLILQSWSLRSVNSGRWLKTMLIRAKARNQVLTEVETGLKTRKENRSNERGKYRSQGWLRKAQKRLVAPKPIFLKGRGHFEEIMQDFGLCLCMSGKQYGSWYHLAAPSRWSWDWVICGPSDTWFCYSLCLASSHVAIIRVPNHKWQHSHPFNCGWSWCFLAVQGCYLG